ncbi:hypothetical protein V6N13_060240 [Hibiscus sabdariffa]
MLEESWLPTDSFAATIQSFTISAETWNHNVFSYIGVRKRNMMARLRGVQRALCSRHSRFLKQLEDDLLIELESLLDQEEMLWRQKSCSDWIQLGDRNTSYFRKKAKIQKLRNRITSLQLNDGVWCDDDATLKAEAVRYYKSLFSFEQPPTSGPTVCNQFQHIDPISLSTLDVVPSSEEIHAALMEIAPLKAPGFDGLHAPFFQKN